MSARLFLGLVIVAVAASVVAGLFVVGGPSLARQDRLDYERYLQLDKIARVLMCKGGIHTKGTPLPEELTLDALRAGCSGLPIAAADLVDKETGAPFAYHRLDDHRFSICATFHDGARTARLNRDRMGYVSTALDPDTGCVEGSNG